MREDAFPPAIAAQITGVGEQTLEVWDRRDFLKPSIRVAHSPQRTRSYSFGDLVAIRVAHALHEGGVELRHVRRVVDYLRRRDGLDLASTQIDVATVLLTDGKDVFEAKKKATLNDALQKTGQRVLFVVPLGEIVAEMQQNVRAIRQAQKQSKG